MTRPRPLVAWMVVVLLLAGSVEAGAATVCLTIDENRDTFSAPDRVAALLLLTREFERAGEQVAAAGCPAQ